MSEKLADLDGLATRLHNMGRVAIRLAQFTRAKAWFIRARDLYLHLARPDDAGKEELLIEEMSRKE